MARVVIATSALVFGLSVASAGASASGNTLSFTPNKGAPGTDVSGSDSSAPNLYCVNTIVVTNISSGTSATASIVSTNGTTIVFRVPNVPAGNATVTFSDGSSPSTCSYSGTFQVVAALAITTTSLPEAGYGVPYSARVTAKGGVGPYSWSVTSGAPPAGVTLASNGVFTGSPETSPPTTLTVQVSDKYGATASATYTIVIEAPPIITVSSLPVGTVGVNYRARLTAEGGVGPYNWSVGASGGLPGGLVVNSAGVLSGKPGTAGTSMLDLQVTDAHGVTGSTVVPITIDPTPQEYAVAIADGAVPVASPPSDDPLLHVRSPRGGVVALAPGLPGKGFWALTRSGRVRGVGGLGSLGSLPRLGRGERPVAIAANPQGTGYWVLTGDGKVFPFGGARPYRLQGRSIRATKSERAVGIASAPGGGGYWVLWSDGEVDAYGSAPLLGSASFGGHRFTAIASTTDGPGYWVVSATGRVFPFGVAWGEPVSGGIVIHGPVVGIAGAPDGAGYWLIGRNGAVRAYGSARVTSDFPNPPGLGRAVAIASSS
ncbi:MAG: Ig domain-containing protein [Acidimicrobiales bacterium]